MNNYSHLSLKEREKVFKFLQEGCGNNEIARRLNRDKSTISRKLQRNEYSDLINYLPDSAHQKAQDRKNEILKKYIFNKLQEKWSPDIIAYRATQDIKVNISAETIYQYIYHPNNQHLEWNQFLMSGRKKRNPFKGHKVSQKIIPNQVSIHERSEVINKRLESGHFEGDLTFFTGDQSRNIGVLIDRATRFLIFVKNKSKTISYSSTFS